MGENNLEKTMSSPTPNLLDPQFILIILTLTITIFSFKKFHFNNNKLSLKAKIFLILSILSIFLPTIIITGTGYILANDTDYGFTKAKFQVIYHLYKPESIPGGRENGTIFMTNKELAGMQNAVQVAYDTPLDETLKGKFWSVIIVKQVGVNPGFDLKTFASAVTKEPTSTDRIPLQIATNNEAYLIQKTSGSLELKILTFVTSDNVLITISTPKAAKDELIQLAESLK